MFDVEARLKSILEGSTDVTYPVRDHDDEGGMDDQMISESDVYTLEEAYFTMIEESLSSSAMYESIMAADSYQLMEILTEADTKNPGAFNIIFKRIRDGLRKFKPSKSIKDLKVAREQFISKWLRVGGAISPIFMIIYLLRRIFKIKGMTAEEAKEALKEAESLRSNLETMARELQKDGKDKEANKIKAHIREIDNAVGDFKQKYAIVLGKEE